MYHSQVLKSFFLITTIVPDRRTVFLKEFKLLLNLKYPLNFWERGIITPYNVER